MKNILDDVHSSLSDAINRVGDFDSEDMPKRLEAMVERLESAIDAAMAISNEIETFITTDHEQVAEDHYWEQRIDEARGK